MSSRSGRSRFPSAVGDTEPCSEGGKLIVRSRQPRWPMCGTVHANPRRNNEEMHFVSISPELTKLVCLRRFFPTVPRAVKRTKRRSRARRDSNSRPSASKASGDYSKSHLCRRIRATSLGSSVPTLFQEIDRCRRPLDCQFGIAGPKASAAFLTIFLCALRSSRGSRYPALTSVISELPTIHRLDVFRERKAATLDRNRDYFGSHCD